MNELERAIMTSSCRDCDSIPKVSDAGRIVETPSGPIQIMHNGLKVRAGGYHGHWMAQIIRALQGHHEPQEELAFHHLLRYVRHNSLIVELGSFWCYYSLWFLREIPGSTAICVEPDPNNLNIGKENAALNELEGRIEFHQAGIGGDFEQSHQFHCESDNLPRSLPCLDMEAVSELAGSRTIEVLHVDTQGAELSFIRSAKQAIAQKRIRFLVISTHHSSISGSRTTHTDCRDMLLEFGAEILAEHDVQQSFSGDGLIVASSFAEDRRIELPRMSLNKAHLSLFPAS